jgi:hypothetical protein
MIQAMNFPRGVLLDVFGIEGNAWHQRQHRGEVALAFGLAKPVFANEFGELDVFAVGLTLLIVILAKVDMKEAAELVREYWREWLEGLAVAERLKPSTYLDGIGFVAATDVNERKIVAVEVGPCKEVMEHLGGEDVVPNGIPLELAARRVRAMAKQAGHSLPRYFTPGDPQSDEFKQWLAEIERYRQIASMKGGGRKAKKQAPTRKRQLLTTI